MFLNFFSRKNKKECEQPSSQVEAGYQIDPDLSYCPECGDEYRADIAACVSCKVALISGTEKLEMHRSEKQRIEARSMEILPSDELTTIQKGSVNDIKALRNLLARERIPAIIAGDEASCKKGCRGPELFLQIREQDVAAAGEVISMNYAKTTALDTYDLSQATAVFDHLAKETVCPACGCRFSPTVGACPECGLCFE